MNQENNFKILPSDCILYFPELFLSKEKSNTLRKANNTKHFFENGVLPNSKEHASTILTLALLYNEQQGYITLKQSEDKHLVIVPTNKVHDLSADCIEARLIPSEVTPLISLISDWIYHSSKLVHVNIIEAAIISQVLRGKAKPIKYTQSEKNHEREEVRYTLTDVGQKEMALIPITKIDEFLNLLIQIDFEKVKLLKAEIEQGIDSKYIKPKIISSVNKEINPWDLESVDNKEKFLFPLKKASLGTKIMIVLALSPFFALFFIAGKFILETNFKLQVTCIVISFITILLFGYLQLPIKSARRNLWNGTQFIRLLFRKEIQKDRDAKPPIFWYLITFISTLLILNSIFVGYALLFHFNQYFVIAFCSFIVFGVSLGSLSKAIKKLVAYSVVSDIVTTPIQSGNLNDLPEIDVEKIKYSNKETRDASSFKDGSPIIFNFIDSEEFPNISEQSLKRFEEANLRWKELYHLYFKRVPILALLISLTKNTSGFVFALDSFKRGLTAFSVLWFIYNLVITPLILKNFERRAQTDATLKRQMDDFKYKKPNITPAIGFLWILVGLSCGIVNLSSEPNFIHIINLVIIVAATIWYFKTTITDQKSLEKKYPVRKPFKLLSLRVFGGNGLYDFLDLIHSWRWFGETRFLDGPDSVGNKFNQFVNFMKGKILDSIVENELELEAEISKMKPLPDANLKYPVNSMQCSNAIWKKALDYFLKTSDIIVVDLSFMSEQNAGIAFEIEKLILEVPLKKVVFLINDKTDKEMLSSIMTSSVLKLPNSSPNYSTDTIKLNLFEYQGGMKKRPNENMNQWKKRVNQNLINKNLVCLLSDIAYENRNTNEEFVTENIPWARWSHKDLRLYIGESAK